MSTAVTQWFMGEDPVHEGAYQINMASTPPQFCWWDGSEWGSITRYLEQAADLKRDPTKRQGGWKGIPWRGLAVKP